ncbi:MAG TPA: ABC-ATPase domain-containing protein [Streptosporangiaceae bacterium]|jgi:predicted ABC-class ATPase
MRESMRGNAARRRNPQGRREEPSVPPGARTGERLAEELRQMDGSGYGRYKSLRGTWVFDAFELEVERVQSDPFAPPSRVAVRLGPAEAGFPGDLWETGVRARALADHLSRGLAHDLRGSAFRVDAGGQEVLARSACEVREGRVTARIGVQLPGHGRRIDGRAAGRELCEVLPRAVANALRWAAVDERAARSFVDCVDDTAALRRMLPGLGLVAFVADGAILPRATGVDQRPMAGGAVPFASPESLRVAVDLPHRGRVTGMGIAEGITLIVGGGFHGKSTLLQALERGVYDHVPGDGRELVATRADAVKIRAEEGRCVTRVDVSSFVSDLPTGADTSDFSTGNASGSTSQAAATAEAVEAGAGVLLVDEDTAATNLMIRDARMQALVAAEKEPLTPFVDLVRPLHTGHGVSTILVMGGCGDYFDVADRVVQLAAYRPYDVTARARELAADRRDARFNEVAARCPEPASVSPEARGRRKISRRDDALIFGENTIDLRALEQIVDPSQVTGIGLALDLLARRHLGGGATLRDALDSLAADLADDGVGILADGYPGDYALPRRHELAAALNRLRGLRVR